MTPLDYDFLRKCLKDRSGLALSADKQYLVESRLLPVVRRAGLGGLPDLVAALRRGDDDALMTKVVEAMTTNETFFFRDKTPFETFRSTVLPALLSARRATRCIRIWCAASSSGQEPYSLAMMLKELGSELLGWRVELFASDLSGEVLEKARSGLYSQFEVQRGLPIQLLIKYFSQVGDKWQIAPAIRGMVKFEQFNLLADFARYGVFDLVFCRNVLIYFDQATKTATLDRLARAVAADGYLALGAAETVVGLTDGFTTIPDMRGFYAPRAWQSPSMKFAGARPAPRLVAISGGR
jgi:chemotaxis protein methyltransferase CheR